MLYIRDGPLRCGDCREGGTLIGAGGIPDREPGTVHHGFCLSFSRSSLARSCAASSLEGSAMALRKLSRSAGVRRDHNWSGGADSVDSSQFARDGATRANRDRGPEIDARNPIPRLQAPTPGPRSPLQSASAAPAYAAAPAPISMAAHGCPSRVHSCRTSLSISSEPVWAALEWSVRRRAYFGRTWERKQVSEQ